VYLILAGAVAGPGAVAKPTSGTRSRIADRTGTLPVVQSSNFRYCRDPQDTGQRLGPIASSRPEMNDSRPLLPDLSGPVFPRRGG